MKMEEEKQFDQFATRIVVRFVSEKENEEVEWEIDEIPEANLETDTVGGSENYAETEFTPFEDGDTYKAVLCVNQERGTIQLFNETTDEEIREFEVEEFFDDDNDNLEDC